MKKTLLMFMTFILLLSMAACGNPDNSETVPPIENDSFQQITSPETDDSQQATVPENDSDIQQDETSDADSFDVQPLDMETVYQNILVAINAGDGFVMFPENNPYIINEFYAGLSEVELKQTVFYIHPITGFACEIMLVEVANETDVQTVVDIFENRIVLGGNDEFYADTAALWKTNAQVQTFGNYVCMIALPDDYTIPEDVFAK